MFRSPGSKPCPTAESPSPGLNHTLQYFLSRMKGLKSCNVTIAFAWKSELDGSEIHDLGVLQDFQKIHVNICMLLQAGSRFYIVKKASEGENPVEKLVTSIKTTLKPDNVHEQSPKLEIIRTVALENLDPSRRQNEREEFLTLLREGQEGPITWPAHA